MDPLPDIPRPDWTWRRQCWPDPVGVIRGLGLSAGRSVVDVGVGAGFFALPAAGVVAPAPVYVIHPDGTLLDEVEAAAIERGLGNVTTISGGASDLSSLLPERVDVVLVVDSFHSVEARTAFAEQVSRSLRPGGRFVVVDWLDRPRSDTTVDGEPRGPPAAERLSPGRVRSAVAPAGFEVAEDVDVSGTHYGLVLRRVHDA